jgi:anti-anti-sigma factor
VESAAFQVVPDGLAIDERECDGVHVLSAAGELDLAAAGAFCVRVDAARGAGHRRLVLDLTRLEFCDSSGLRALLGAAEEVVASAGRIAVVAPAEGAVARLFAITGAGEFLPLHASLADALAALAHRNGAVAVSRRPLRR